MCGVMPSGGSQIRIKAYAIGRNMKLDRVVIEQKRVPAYTPVAGSADRWSLFEKLVKGDIVIAGPSTACSVPPWTRSKSSQI